MQFDFEELKSSCGKRIELHDPGRRNETDGPDFCGASISVDGLRWFGDVEIHHTASDWYAHGHHQDSNYDRVILHVVFETGTRATTLRSDGSTVYLLPLKSYLPENLAGLLQQFNRTDRIPCAGNLRFISEKAFQRQLELARTEYFEQKVDHLLAYYDPNLRPSEAWKQTLITGLFEVLGISHNREPMIRLARKLLPLDTNRMSPQQLIDVALQRSGIDEPEKRAAGGWKFKGSRPANQPSARIPQAALLLKVIREVPLRRFMNQPLSRQWDQLFTRFESTPPPGAQQRQILFAVAYLPALYLLGHLFGSQSLKDRAFERWKSVEVPVPGSILTPLEKTDLNPAIYRQNIGAVYQLKRYCLPRRCRHCQVFKHAINS